VNCYFARSPQDADAQLIKRIRALKHPREWTLVTSDRQVARVGQDCGVRVVSSHEFARRLTAPAPPTLASQDERRDVRLSEAEIEEWLRLFGEPPGE
jgi:uncharacterized protein